MLTLRTLVCALFFLFVPLRIALADIIAEFESPASGQTVSGVGIIRGWAFSDQTGVQITQVTFSIDGKTIGAIPCCSERPDVRDAYPQHPAENTLNSGFGLIRNYGVQTNGLHTFTITIQDSNGVQAQRVITHTVSTVKIGGSEFLDQFSIAAAQVDQQGQDILLSNAQVRDKETQQLRQIDARLRWVSSIQGLSIVNATTLGVAPASVRTAQTIEHVEQALVTSLQAVFESPSEGSPSSGIGVIRGWAFPPVGQTIQSVQLFVDGQLFQSIPCCSTRQDVADAYPDEQPNAKNSGFGVTFNYWRLTPGQHTFGVSIKDSSDAPALLLQSQITVVSPAGFEFLDEFDLAMAEPRINGEELVISGVKVRDKTSRQTSFRTFRFRWDIASQGFILVSDALDSEQLLGDNFTDGEASDWTIISGQWSVVQGEFVENSDAETRSVAINGPAVGDFQLTAQLRSTDDDAIGFVFRFQNPEDYYVVEFHLQKNRVQLRKRSANDPLSTTTPFSFTEGVPFEASLRVQEKRILVFVNGRTVIDFTDAEAGAGKVGFYAQANKYAAFDDVRLVTLKTVKGETSNTIYVDAAAGQPQDGQTPATAWKTINQALQDSRFRDTAGNTILIASGLYREQVDILATMSGSPGTFNVIRAAEGAEVIVDGEKDTPKARPEGVLIHTGARYVRVEGLHIQNAQHRGILVFESGPGEIVDNQVHLSGDSGIEFWYGARNYEIVNNVIHHNEQNGIAIAEGSEDDPARFGANRAIMIRNNLIYQNGPDGGDGIKVQDERAHAFVAYNNTVISNAGDGISIDSSFALGDIRNNIVVNNARIGLKMIADELVPRAYNNLFNNGTDGTKNFDGRHGPGIGSLSADPLFVNALGGDFRLQNGSPSLNTGDPAPQFNDLDTTRNDMGAYGGPIPLLGVPPLN